MLARTSEHLQMCALVMVIASLVALPVGLAVGHVGRGGFLAVNAAGVGRAVPSFGVLAFAFPISLRHHLPGAFGYWPTLVTLVVLAVPPLLTNTYVGVRNVDRDTVEAARGMGMGEFQLLTRLELPLAMPLMLDTLRTVCVQVVATATLGSVIGWGGLGRFIVDGFASQDTGMILGGAIVVAALAVLVDVVLGLLTRLPFGKLPVAKVG
ncbi:MAG: ABC transporter permease subunit [Actinomycetota bacterium]